MGKPTWERSIEKAKLASLKTFEGRLETARASFEQIPPSGGGRPSNKSKTLAHFAEEAGLELKTLKNYRTIAAWWGNRPPAGTVSWTLAREAMESGEWKDGAAFQKFILGFEPPVYELEGYEPHTFLEWTQNALRVYLGREPNNHLRLTLKEIAGEKVTEDEEHAAEAQDALMTAGEETKKITDSSASREVRNTAEDVTKEIEDQHIENVHRDLEVLGPDDDTILVDEIRKYLDKDFSKLIHSAEVYSEWLIGSLEKISEWMSTKAHLIRDDESLGELMLTRLAELRTSINQSFDAASGVDRLESELQELLR